MNEELDNHIGEDLACVGCGYNLRFQPFDGHCPECFAPVNRTLRGDLLRFSAPDWLNRLRLGMAVKLWNVVAGLVMGLVIVVTALSTPSAIGGVLTIVVAALGCWATFLITTQEPRISHSEDPVTWRRVLRLLAIVSLIGSGVTVSLWPNLQITNQASTTILGLVGVLVVFGELTYFQGFALRDPDEKLARQCMIVKWGLSSSMALNFGLQLAVSLAGGPWPGAGPVGPPSTASIWLFVMVAATCTFGLGMAVFGIWHIVVLVKLFGMFRNATNLARAAADGAIPTQE
ncbi:MAG: hypothetical protein ACYTHJ_03905 [Planctomycetota bacterium]|jgi:hypothetical protein